MSVEEEYAELCQAANRDASVSLGVLLADISVASVSMSMVVEETLRSIDYATPAREKAQRLVQRISNIMQQSQNPLDKRKANKLYEHVFACVALLPCAEWLRAAARDFAAQKSRGKNTAADATATITVGIDNVTVSITVSGGRVDVA